MRPLAPFFENRLVGDGKRLSPHDLAATFVDAVDLVIAVSTGDVKRRVAEIATKGSQVPPFHL
jgi:hypothetical protein